MGPVAYLGLRVSNPLFNKWLKSVKSNPALTAKKFQTPGGPRFVRSVSSRRDVKHPSTVVTSYALVGRENARKDRPVPLPRERPHNQVGENGKWGRREGRRTGSTPACD